VPETQQPDLQGRRAELLEKIQDTRNLPVGTSQTGAVYILGSA